MEEKGRKGGVKQSGKCRTEVAVTNKLILLRFFAVQHHVYALRLLREVTEKVVNISENTF